MKLAGRIKFDADSAYDATALAGAVLADIGLWKAWEPLGWLFLGAVLLGVGIYGARLEALRGNRQ
jgi:hypothetical protein